MTQSIPASQIVNIVPGVVSAGGLGLALSGLVLTTSTRVPIGQVVPFANLPAVVAYFGAGTPEAAYAAVYFQGYDNSQTKPGNLWFAQYNTAAVAGYQRGGKLALTLAQLTAIAAAPLTVATDGVSHTTANINLSAATSFSNAATIINTALAAATIAAVCTYDATAGAFVFTSPTTGAASSVAITSGQFAAALNLTATTGMVTSPGAAIAVPAAFMNAVVGQTQNWASFTTLFSVGTTSGNGLGIQFAAWVATQNNRWMFVGWDTDAAPTQANDTTSFGYLVKQAGYSGVFPLWMPSDTYKAPFVLGLMASIDFTQPNGRADFAFKGQNGLIPDVTDVTTAANLMASGYNFYGSYATANSQFNYLFPGSVSGPFLWADSYANQIWLNNSLQLALMTLLTTIRSIPYNNAGYTLIRQAVQDPVNAGLNAGVIRPGVTLSAQQAANVNNAAGVNIDQTLSSRGWYFQVQPATAQVRAARQSPPCTLWYTDGQSVQQITLNSLDIQ